MIKKLAITGLACVCSLCISAEAFAYSTRSKIYFGADYVYSDIKYKNNTLYEMDDGYNGISPVIGFSSYGVGLEAWYMFSDNGWKYDQDVNGPRFGIGLQYEIIPHIALRTMFHYTSLNSGSTDFYDGVSEVSGGVRIIF